MRAAQTPPAEGGGRQFGDTYDEAGGGVDHPGGVAVGDDGVGVDRIVCQLLVSIAVRQYPSQPAIVLGAILMRRANSL